MKFRLSIRYLILISVILFALLPVGATDVEAEASTYFVSSTGSETPCTQAAPCYPDLALTYADPGDTIYFMQGTYTLESDPMLTISKGVTLIGGWDGAPTGAVVVNPEAYPTIIDGVDTYRIFSINETSGNQVVISGFTFQNGYNSLWGGAIYLASGNVDILNSTFLENYADSYGGAIAIGSSGEINILNNSFIDNSVTYGGGSIYAGSASSGTLIEGNVFSGGSADYGTAIHDDNCSLTINRNTFVDTFGDTLIRLSSEGPVSTVSNNFFIRPEGTAIRSSGAHTSPFQIINNTFVGGTKGISSSNDQVNIMNNIFVDITVSIPATSEFLTGSNNLFYSNISDPTLLTDSVLEDPDFVNPAEDDYHISEDSPAINAGATVALNDDFDGDSRPSGGGFDIGADEVQNGMEVFIPILLK